MDIDMRVHIELEHHVHSAHCFLPARYLSASET